MSLMPRHRRSLASARHPANGQRGAFVIVALFTVVGLSLLGLIAAQMLSVGSRDQIRSWESEQALYAAESALQWAAYQINQQGTCNISASGNPLQTGTSIPAWFDVTAAPVTISGRPVCQVTATGKAGGTAASPRTQRRIHLLYRAVVVE